MKTLRRMFEHANWANRRLLQALIANPADNPRINGLMAHIVQAERVWLTRLQGGDSSGIVLWAELSPAECLTIAEANASGYEAYLAGADEDGLDDIVFYRNQAGQPFETSARDILSHVAMHGQYHRGQINTLLKAENKEPVPLDLILFVREL